MRISDWSSDVCSSDLHAAGARLDVDQLPVPGREREPALQVDHAESGRAAGPGRVEMRLAVAARHAPAITETGEQRAEILAFHIDFQVRARGRDRKSTRLNSSH